nr:Chain B, Arrestin domain-containing protein 3
RPEAPPSYAEVVT